jgi:hypothetical protein
VRSRSSGEQSCAPEGGKKRGKRAGEDPHPKAELRCRLVATGYGEAAAATVKAAAARASRARRRRLRDTRGLGHGAAVL